MEQGRYGACAVSQLIVTNFSSDVTKGGPEGSRFPGLFRIRQAAPPPDPQDCDLSGPKVRNPNNQPAYDQ